MIRLRRTVCTLILGSIVLVGSARLVNAQIDVRGRHVLQSHEDVENLVKEYWDSYKVTNSSELGGSSDNVARVVRPFTSLRFDSQAHVSWMGPSSDALLVDLLDKLPPQASIQLTGNAVTDRALQHLRHHSATLSVLHVAGSFSGEGLDELKLPAIKTLTIIMNDSMSVPHSGFGVTSHGTLRGRLTVPGVKGIASWNTLENLQIENCNLDDNDLQQLLARLRELRSLSLAGNRLTGRTLSVLEELPHVERIELQANRLRDRDLTVFPNLPLLSVLSLSNNPIGDEGVGVILGADCPRLNQLNLSRTAVTENVFDEIAGRDIFLSLDQCELNFENLQKRHTAGNLTRLILSDTGLTDSELDVLDTFPNLIGIDLSSNDISDAVINRLTKMPHLEWVSLGRTRVTKDGVNRLKAARPNVTVSDAAQLPESPHAIAEPGGSRHMQGFFIGNE